MRMTTATTVVVEEEETEEKEEKEVKEEKKEEDFNHSIQSMKAFSFGRRSITLQRDT